MAEKMYSSPLYILKNSITVEKKSYNANTVPVPKGKISEIDAKRLIKSGVAAEGPAKSSLVDMESAAKKKVKEQDKTISEQHGEIEKLQLEVKGLPALTEKLKVADEKISELTKAAEESEKLVSDLGKKVASLEKENTDLREVAGGGS